MIVAEHGVEVGCGVAAHPDRHLTVRVELGVGEHVVDRVSGLGLLARGDGVLQIETDRVGAGFRRLPHQFGAVGGREQDASACHTGGWTGGELTDGDRSVRKTRDGWN